MVPIHFNNGDLTKARKSLLSGPTLDLQILPMVSQRTVEVEEVEHQTYEPPTQKTLESMSTCTTSDEGEDTTCDESLWEPAPVTITSQVHLPSLGGKVFLPLCAKPSTLKAATQNPTLIETYIRNALMETDKDIVVFIADGEVMETATMAMGKVKASSEKKAARTAARVSAALRAMVDDALVRIVMRGESCARLKGVMHWSDVVASKGFQAVFSALEGAMHDQDSEDAAVKDIQIHIKTLVKNLFTQRVEKAKSSGIPLTNVFSGKGLELLPKERYHKRYMMLERSCLLEISSILAGFEHDGQLFTEMRYLTNDPRGMSFIAECIQKIRDTLNAASELPVLKEAAAKQHGITFARWKVSPRPVFQKTPCTTSDEADETTCDESLVSESESESQAPRVMRKVTWGI